MKVPAHICILVRHIVISQVLILFLTVCKQVKFMKIWTIIDNFECLSYLLTMLFWLLLNFSNAALYVLLRAVDRFAATYKRYPGVFDS